MPDYSIAPLIEPQFIAASATAVTFAPPGSGTTVPANTVFRFATARVINVGSVPCALTVWRVPSGATQIPANQVVPVTVIIPVANNTFPHFDIQTLWGATLRPGDAIFAQAGIASALVIEGDGAVIV